MHKQSFYDPTLIVLQLLYNFFRCYLLIGTIISLIVIILCTDTIVIRSLSSDKYYHIKNYKIRRFPDPVSFNNLSQYPHNKIYTIIKHRPYIPQKYASKKIPRYSFFAWSHITTPPILFISCVATNIPT